MSNRSKAGEGTTLVAPADTVTSDPTPDLPRALKLADDDGILGRVYRFGRGLERATAQTGNPFAVEIEAVKGPVEALIENRRTLLFGTNSYLGLNFHPACKAAAIAATQSFGTGSTASRVAGGNTKLHLDLEHAVADFYGSRDAIVFSTGFMANLGVIGALVGRGDGIFLDSHCHASIIDAAKLSGAEIAFFRHNDPDDLARLFRVNRIPHSRTLVVMEGLYSVTGDVALLDRLLPLAKRHGAVTMVDEAHALGIYGKHGRGVVEHMGMEQYADVILGTFSKSAGVIGGFSVTAIEHLRDMRLRARTYLYTASLPPSVVASARESLRIIAGDVALRDGVWRNTGLLREGLTRAGIDFSGQGPIGCIRLPKTPGAAIWRALLERGIYVNLLVPPAIPEGEAALRLSVSAAHTPDHIEQLVTVLADILSSPQPA